MTEEEAELKRRSLIRIIADAEQFLARYGVKHWPAVLCDSRMLLESRDFRGVENICSIFGGMGSFNDLVIHPINGHRVDESQIDAVIEKFQSLKGDIYTLATELRHYGNQ